MMRFSLSSLPRLRRVARIAAGGALAAAILSAPARAGPGDEQFTVIASHDPSAFIKAVRAGEDFVRGGGRRFRIILSAAGVIVAIPGSSAIQRDYLKMKRSAGLQIIACKETMDGISKANKRRIPVIAGVTVQACASIRNKMTVAGWQVAPGL